jgi:hypothetical protein
MWALDHHQCHGRPHLTRLTPVPFTMLARPIGSLADIATKKTPPGGGGVSMCQTLSKGADEETVGLTRVNAPFERQFRRSSHFIKLDALLSVLILFSCQSGP